MRKMRHNKRAGCPSQYVCFDTETSERDHPDLPGLKVNLLRLGTAVRFRMENEKRTRNERLTYGDPATFWRWVYDGLDKRKRTYLFCHNAGFDLTAIQLWAELENGNLRPVYRRRDAPAGDDQGDDDDPASGLMVIDDPPTILDLEDRQKRKLTVVDLMNYFPVALSVIGESVALPKLPFPGDEATIQYWEEYCANDTEIVARAVEKLVGFVKGADLGNLRYTMSGQSLALYQHRCMTEPITWEHATEAKTLERRALYTGRTRAYFLGCAGRRAGELPEIAVNTPDPKGHITTANVYRLDANSAYPYVMKDNVYPVCYLGRERGVSHHRLGHLMSAYEAVADVRITSLNEPYPLRDQRGVRWCVGTFDTSLCGPELRRALAEGAVRCVYAVQYYKRGKPFSRFADVVLELRARYKQAGDTLLAKAAKLLGNALHGKFAQWAGGWESRRDILPPVLWGTWPDFDPDTLDYVAHRAIGSHVQAKRPREEKPANFPLIAAYVTAYAREHMRRLIGIAGASEVYYEDVDSLHVGEVGYQNLLSAGWIDPERPGALKVEAVASSAQWVGPRYYRHGEKWVRCGISPRAVIDAKGDLVQTHFHGLTSMLNGQPPPGPITQEVHPTEPSPVNHGTIAPSGWLAWPVEIV